MTVLVEGISVIIKREVIERKFPGGWQDFVKDVPNQTLCADDELARIVTVPSMTYCGTL